MVEDIDGGGDEFSGFSVSSGDEEHGRFEQVELETGGDKARDVSGGGDENLSGKMSTLWTMRLLRLEVSFESYRC